MIHDPDWQLLPAEKCCCLFHLQLPHLQPHTELPQFLRPRSVRVIWTTVSSPITRLGDTWSRHLGLESQHGKYKRSYRMLYSSYFCCHPGWALYTTLCLPYKVIIGHLSVWLRPTHASPAQLSLSCRGCQAARNKGSLGPRSVVEAPDYSSHMVRLWLSGVI